MRQTVTILCALIAALLVASGLIVAGGVERMAQLEEQSGLIAQLQRQLDASGAGNETLTLRLDAVTKERDEAMANAESLERRLAEAQRAAQEGMADADAVNAVDAGALEDADGNARPDRENSPPALPAYPLRNGPSLLLK